MKVFFDVITNHTADAVDYAEKEYGYLSKGAYPYLDPGRPALRRPDDAACAKVDARLLPVHARRYTPRADEGPGLAQRPDDVPQPGRLHLRRARPPSTATSPASTTCGPSGPRSSAAWRRSTSGGSGTSASTASGSTPSSTSTWTSGPSGPPPSTRTRPSTAGKNFFMFGEVYSADTAVTSPYVTRGRLDATLDFPFQDAARAYASQGGRAPTARRRLRRRLQLHHRQGQRLRAGHLPRQPRHGPHRLLPRSQDNPKATDAELLRARQARQRADVPRPRQPGRLLRRRAGLHRLRRRQGRPADRCSPPRSPTTSTTTRLGTDRTARRATPTTRARRSTRTIAALSELRKDNPALRDGVQTERYAATGPASTPSPAPTRATGTEYVVARQQRRRRRRPPTFATGSAGTGFRGALRHRPATVTQRRRQEGHRHRAGRLRGRPQGRRAARRPRRQALAHPQRPGRRRHRHRRDSAPTSTGGQLDRVVFAAQVGNGAWQTLGSADHAPYQVTQASSTRTCRPEPPLRYKAVVVDRAGRTASDLAATTAGRRPPPAKPERRRPRLRGRALPAHRRRLRRLASLGRPRRGEPRLAPALHRP